MKLLKKKSLIIVIVIVVVIGSSVLSVHKNKNESTKSVTTEGKKDIVSTVNTEKTKTDVIAQEVKKEDVTTPSTLPATSNDSSKTTTIDKPTTTTKKSTNTGSTGTSSGSTTKPPTNPPSNPTQPPTNPPTEPTKPPTEPTPSYKIRNDLATQVFDAVNGYRQSSGNGALTRVSDYNTIAEQYLIYRLGQGSKPSLNTVWANYTEVEQWEDILDTPDAIGDRWNGSNVCSVKVFENGGKYYICFAIKH